MDIPLDEILIVDDTPANLKLLSQMLSGQGFKVRVASNGRQALTSIKVALPDLVLLDIKMPEMSGFEVCKLLQEDPITSDIPVIFISALDNLTDKLMGFKVGGVDYISKPFQLDEVIARVRTHLALKRTQKMLKNNNERMLRELNLAGHLQNNFIPQKFPVIPGWQISAELQPARETSGDFYDIFPLQEGKLGILIADVVDKGVAAALLMVLVWSFLREQCSIFPNQPDRVFHEVNQRMLTILNDSEFVTAFLGILDTETGQLTYANAGHNPPLWAQTGAEKIVELTRTGLPLGISEDLGWESAEIEVKPDDVLFLFTDGLTEACNKTGEFSGLQRLKTCLLPFSRNDSERIIELMKEELTGFLQGEILQDDLALMVIKRCHQDR